MRLIATLKSGEEGMIVGYAPGKKGQPVAIILIDQKLRAVRLRNIEINGFAKLREGKPTHSLDLAFGDQPARLN